MSSPSFLDSAQAAALTGVTPFEIRSIAGSFAKLCRKELGKEPHALSGSDMHGVLGHMLPNEFKRRDPKAEKAPAILEAYVEFLIANHPDADGEALRHGFHSTIGEFLETVRTGVNPHHHHHHHGHQQETVTRSAPKVGRNDPCPCGSGKKYKKCHGKAG